MTLSITNINRDKERHERKCTICHHENREQIDEDYLRWRPISEICEEYSIPERSLFRHVDALEMQKEKMEQRRKLYLQVIERAPMKAVTTAEALQAAKILEQVDGKLIDTVEFKGKTPEQREEKFAAILKLWDQHKTEKQE